MRFLLTYLMEDTAAAIDKNRISADDGGRVSTSGNCGAMFFLTLWHSFSRHSSGFFCNRIWN